MIINGVEVQAGVYPVYASDKSYLLLLRHDEARGLYPSTTFEVNAKGLLTPITDSSGIIHRRSSALYDQPVDKVVMELKGRIGNRSRPPNHHKPL
jgi:hypothetical protein